MLKAIVMNSKDNVATVIDDIPLKGKVHVFSYSGEIAAEIQVIKAIPFGHKIALFDTDRGDEIIKYAEVIGMATKAIKKGDYVHIHNVKSAILYGNK
jgi:altronate dehydratase small subunit